MTPFQNPIYVSQPSLPPLEAFAAALDGIWSRRRLTNGGPVLDSFHHGLAQTLQTDNLGIFANGALALQIGLQALGLEGEVVTTPFTFVATANALAQCRLTPVFADIEPRHLTIDPDCLEACITPRTTAILAVHVFGVPCQLDRLSQIAERHGLALIYDAAHAFGVTVDGRSISAFGDMSMFSFHATKLFHTVEGGALTFKDPALKPILDQITNHGLDADGNVTHPGTNAKLSELHALMGTLMLPTMAETIAHGAIIEATYRARLGALPGLRFLDAPRAGIATNHSFMPLLIDETEFGLSADRLRTELIRLNVHPRRYFNPLVSEMTAFRQYKSADPLTCAHTTVGKILALPTFTGLTTETVHRICDMVEAIRVSGAATIDA